jgi:sterol desaturase/sphingolipid hydroxylase (fatty acid hydroxylase superfamily)
MTAWSGSSGPSFAPATLSEQGESAMKFGQGPFGRLSALEHSKAAYVADFVLLSAFIVGLAAFLVVTGARERRGELAAFALLGLGGWTLVEYVLHRFVLHGLEPFQRWHALHHQRQTELIYAPTILTAGVLMGFVLLPAWMFGGLSRACALMLGLLIGYLAYSITHHAVHHWSGNSSWLRRRKRWHSLHHRPSQPPGRYGVVTAFWDHVFHSTAEPRLHRCRDIL